MFLRSRRKVKRESHRSGDNRFKVKILLMAPYTLMILIIKCALVRKFQSE